MSPHNDENIGGVYTLRKQVNQSAVIEFKDIGIIFVKRENIKSSLEERKQKRIDPTRGNFNVQIENFDSDVIDNRFWFFISRWLGTHEYAAAHRLT